MSTNFETLSEQETDASVQHKEGKVAKAIEDQTAKIPSDLFLWASLGAMTASLTLKLMGKKQAALFVGEWVSPFLLFGIYNKLVKLEGHDSKDKGKSQPA